VASDCAWTTDLRAHPELGVVPVVDLNEWIREAEARLEVQRCHLRDVPWTEERLVLILGAHRKFHARALLSYVQACAARLQAEDCGAAR
jgi:hypothetical protein